MEILKLDGKVVDLMPKQVAQTLQINDLAEVKDRQANFTNRFTLPPTPNNIQVMDYLGIAGNQSLKPYQRIPAKLIVDGIELISNGYAKVNESGNGYDVVVYDGNISLSEALKDRSLNQLNYNDLNHFLSEATYIESFTNTEGYIYAFAYFGVKRPYSLIRIDYQAPSLFLHTVWDKVFKDQGFTYEGDIFESEDFKSEIISPANGYLVSEDNLITEDLGTLQSNNVSRNEFENEFKTFEDNFTYDYSNLSGKLYASDNKSVTTFFNGRIKLNINYKLQIQKGYAYLNIYKNNSILKQLYTPTDSNGNAAVVYFPVEIGDKITVKVFSQTDFPEEENEGQPTSINDRYELNFNTSINLDIEEQIGGQFIDFSLIMPETSQIDFVKDVMQRYGLIYTQDRNTNNFKFIRLENLLNDRENAEDWSDHLVSLGVEQYSIGSYARSNKMAYTYEKDVLNLDYDGTLTINNELLESEKTLFTSIYKIRQSPFYIASNPVYLIPIWEEVEDDDMIIIQPVKSELSLFKLKYIQTSITYQLFADGATNSFTGEVPFLSLDKIQFQYYINNNYQALTRLLERPKLRISSFNLSTVDIYNIDFFRLKYLKQLGQYYYLNKVDRFQSGKNTLCELVQVVGVSKNSPPTQLGQYTIFVSHGSSFIPSLRFFTDLTTPKYFDPEFDNPERIRITGGFNSNVKIELDGIEQFEPFDFDANNYTLKFTDLKNDTASHGYIFPFKIKSFNSEEYSTVSGELRMNVRAKVLVGPIADAGPDATYRYNDLDTGFEENTKELYLDGSESQDNETIETILWSVISQPAGSNITINNPSSLNAVVDIVDNDNQYGEYTFELTVTDNDDLTDTDQVVITINFPI
tara:strand:- start:15192 stop:17780 length:2589 start_codon:yes stop_codon:yes gene_type:complete